jgi:hypothetical protein
MRWICLLGLLCFTFLPAQAGHSPPKILLSVNVQSPGEGQSPMEVTSINVPPDGETIQVRTLPEVTEKNLIDVQQDASGSFRLMFNHVGQVNLSAVTAQNQGRILVVLLNGIVIYAPTIDQQITNGELDIPHPLDPRVVQILQDEAKQNVKQANRT